MEILENLDLLSVGFVTASTAVLGFTVYFNNRKSVTNKTFLAFSILTVLWSIANYAHYQVTSVALSFWLIRFVIFIGVWHALTFFQLFFVFPKEQVNFPKTYKYVFIPLIAATSILTLTPLVFEKVAEVSSLNRITKIQNGPAIALFGIVITSCIISSLLTLLIKTLKARGIEKRQFKVILGGTFLTFTLIIIFNFLFPAFLNNANFIPFSALFIFPFVTFTSYAILHHKLFKVKVTATALLVFALTIATFAEVVLTGRDIPLLIFRSSIFTLVLIFGILLIKGVLREVEQRELIEKQEKELEIANDQQTKLIHFITHQVKGFFTKSRNVFASVLEGDYGSFPAESKHILEEGLKSDTKAVDTVQEILNASNIRKGTMTYTMKQLDFKSIIEKEVAKQKEIAEHRGIKLETDFNEGNYMLEGDEGQLEHVIRNLIDNAIKYTPSGTITVRLSREEKKIVAIVEDTGGGITPQDMKRLFTEGGRGENSVKVNVESTGYGLYIAKNIIEKHGGTIHAESEGAGKGSKFIVELPVK